MPGYEQHLQALQGFLGDTFGGANGGGAGAWLRIYNQLNLQAAMQGYQDVYIELSWMSVCLIAAGVHAKQEPSRPGPWRRRDALSGLVRNHPNGPARRSRSLAYVRHDAQVSGAR